MSKKFSLDDINLNDYDINTKEIKKKKKQFSLDDIDLNDYDIGVDDKYISTFISDSQNYFKSQSGRTNSYKSGISAYDDFINSDTRNDLNTRANNIRVYLNANKNRLDSKAYSDVMSYLDGYKKDNNTLLKSFRDSKTHYSQWKTEEDYNFSIKNNDNTLKYSQMSLDDLKKEKEEYDKVKKDVNFSKYSKVFAPSGNPQGEAISGLILGLMDEKNQNKTDYDSHKKWEQDYKDKAVLYYDSKGNAVTYESLIRDKEHEQIFEDINGDTTKLSAYVNAQEAQKKVLELDKKYQELETQKMVYQTNGFIPDAIVAEEQNVLDAINQQKAIIEDFNSLGYDFDELQHYNRMMEDREAEVKKAEEAKKYAEEHEIMATFKSMLSTPMMIGEYIGNLVDSAQYGYANVYDDKYTNQSQVYQSTVANIIDDAITNTTNSEFAGWLASTAYSGVTSAAQSAMLGAVGTILSGGNVAVGTGAALSIMGTQAAASSFNTSVRNGSTSGEAISFSLASGIGEALFEKLPLDNIFKLAKGAGKTATKEGIATLLKGLVKQSAIEGLEEGGTELWNAMADAIINGDHSAYNIAVDKYLKQGYSESDAKKMASTDWLGELISSMVGGFIGGGVTGSAVGVPSFAINQGIQNAQYDALGKSTIQNENVQGLVEDAQSLVTEGEKNALNKLANKVAGVENVDNLSKRQSKKYTRNVGKLVDEVASAKLNSIESAQTEAIKHELESNGVEDVSRATNIVVKKLKGQSLTKAETEIFESVDGNTIIDSVKNLDVKSAVDKDNLKRTENALKKTGELVFKENKSVYHKKMVEESGYTTTEGKTTVDATGVEVDSMIIDSLDGEDISLKVNMGEDSAIVLAGELNLNDNYAVMLEGLKRIGKKFNLSTSSANKLLALYESYNGDAFTFYKAMEAGVSYGHYNIREYFNNNEFVKDLPQEYQEKLYEIGRENVQKNAEEKQALVELEGTTKATGKVTFAEGVKYHKLNKHQKAQVDFSQVLAKTFGFDLEIFQSPKNAQGKSIGENGSYSANANLMRLDIDAGTIDGKSLILFTQSHELTHFIQKWSPEKYMVFADFLMEKYAKSDVPVQKLIEQKIEESKISATMDKSGKHHVLTESEAFDEIVANACEDFLADPNIQQTILEIAEIDQSIAQKIKNFIKNLVARIEKALRGLQGQSAEAQFVRELDMNAIQELKDLWMEALKDARENVLEARERDIGNNVQFDAETDSIAPMYSERTWSASEYVQEREATAQKIAKTLNIDVQDALKYIDDVNSVAKLIADDRVRLDYEPNLDSRATVVKPNSEYKYTVDMSTLCSKRLLFTGTFDAIQKALPNTVFDSDDIVELREMMKEKGFEVACGICYVESTRREIGRITQDFIDSYKQSQKTGKPITRINSNGKAVDLKKTNEQKKTTADKSTDKFFAEKDYTPTLADLNTTDIDIVKKDHPLVYEAYLNFMNARGQAKPKLLETRAEYKGEILKHFASKSAVAARNKAGGLRLQSYSDFEVPHLIDMMQVIMDMSRVGLMSQAYTKVPAFAYAFGNTGVKINLSLIAKGDGIDADGNLIFDDVEGINHEEAFKIRDRFSKNVGTILVGKNDAHIIAAMADDRIDFIIPFHKSSWKESLYDALGLTGYDDYTNTQNEKAIEEGRKISNFAPSEYWDYSKSGDENAQIYLQKCKEDGRIPKFPQFQNYSGYWKLLIDFKMYDNEGVGSPQMPVKPTYENKDIKRILDEYKGGHRKLPVAQEVVDEFIEKKKSSAKDTKFQDRDSTGRELSPKQVEFFKDSKVRDADGNLLVVYHGTRNANFSVFKRNHNYFTDSKDMADSYSPRGEMFEGYLNIQKPYELDALGEKWSKIPIDAETKEFVQKYGGNVFKEGGKWRTTPADIVSAVEDAIDEGEVDYDGVIIKNVDDTGSYYKDKEKHIANDYIAFKSNQFKNIDNLNPTDNEDIRYQDRDSEGNELSPQQIEFFKNSKIRDEDGNLRVVYHGTNEEFTVFDKTKGRSSMDIQGSFFSPWDLDAQGYGQNVKAYYLNITNPASEGVAYKALNRFKGQNYAGIKAREYLESLGYDGVNNGDEEYIAFNSNQIKLVDNLNPTESDDIRYQDRNYAPTFYSQMGRVIESVKQEKLGAASVVPMLKGKGIKNEEIKWSGIETFLEGKKSVTKQELLDFIVGSQLQIIEQVSGEDIDLRYDSSKQAYNLYDSDGKVIDTFTYNEFIGGYVADSDEEIYSDANELRESLIDAYDMSSAPKWAEYKLNGGSKYREIVFQLPNSSYSNNAMKVHWGEDAEGILAHARIQDFMVDGKKMLFVEEIQSDWHNAGHKDSYESDITTDERTEFVKLEKVIDALNEQRETINKDKGMLDIDYFKNEKMSFDEYSNKSIVLIDKLEKITSKLNKSINKREKIFSKIKNAAPDAPFRNTYHEYVLKRLLRMAAEEGYDSIGWTPADVQSKRYSDEFAEAYRIEYDQDIPKFLNKYGKKWGAKVGTSYVSDGTEVWSMDITDSMKDSVLYDGQTMFQDRPLSNREILVDALSNSDELSIEDKNRLEVYGQKIEKINEYEKELSDLGKQIHEIITTSGSDRTQLNALYTRSDKLRKKISRVDGELLNIEAMQPVKKLVEIRKKQILKSYKETVKEQRISERDRKSRTVMKNKIKGVVRELNSILSKGSKEKNVKIPIQPAVAKALELAEFLFDDDLSNNFILTQADIDPRQEEIKDVEKYRNFNKIKEKHMETMLSIIEKEGTESQVANLKDTISEIERKMGYLEKKLSSLITNEKKKLNQGGVGEAVKALAEAYSQLQNSQEDYVKAAYNEGVYNYIKGLADRLAGAKVKEMSADQMYDVYTAFKAVLTTVRQSNKLFINGKREDVQKMSSSIMMEISLNKKTKTVPYEKLDALKGKMLQYSWNELKPYYAFQRIGSSILLKLYESARQGEDVLGRDYKEAIEFAEKIKRKYGYDSWDMDEKYEIKLEDGRTFTLTLQEIMSIYAYSKREQAYDHMMFGGFVFNNKKFFKTEDGVVKGALKPKTYRATDAEAYRISAEDFGQIGAIIKQVKGLKGFVDEMQGYLSTDMAAKGNEVSRVLYGVDWFNEKNYFPIKSSRDFLAIVNNPSENYSLRNSGMTKTTVPHAKNPLVLEDFMTVWAEHVGKMSTYHSLVIPIDNLNKVLGYKEASTSMKTVLDSVFGKSAKEYLDNFLKDLNGGVSSQGAKSPIASMFGKFKKTAVAASTSVVVQQPTAILRAMAEIDGKYFVGASDKLKHNEKWELIKKYAPIAVIKELGGFDIGSGRKLETILTMPSYEGKDKVKGFFTNSTYRNESLDNAFMWGATKADEIGWNIIWSAVEREVKDTGNLKYGTEEFYKKCGERFTEVVHKTQVYDSTFTRSGFQRSKSDLVQMSMSFMGEPTTTFNMLYDAVLQSSRKKISKGKATRIVGATVASIIMAAVMKSFIYALRDDDEDESYLEKYLESTTESLISDLFIPNMLPFVKDITSILSGWSVERTDFAIFTDLYDSFSQLSSDTVSGYRKVEDLIGSIASLFGIPAKNLLRTGREIYNVGKNIFDNNVPYAQGLKDAALRGVPFTEEKSKTDKLYRATVNGQQQVIDRYEGENIDNSLKKGLRDNDKRILKGVDALLDSDYTKYGSIIDQIASEGKFTKEVVSDAIQSETNYFGGKIEEGAEALRDSNDKAYKDVVKELRDRYRGIYTQDEIIKMIKSYEFETEEETDEEESIYKMKYVEDTLEKGDTYAATEMIEDIVSTKIANGKTEEEARKSVRSSLTSYWKPLYQQAFEDADSYEQNDIRESLYEMGVYGSYEEIDETLHGWKQNYVLETYKPQYIEAYQNGDTAEMRRIEGKIYSLGVYKNSYKTVRGWVD